MADLGIFIGGSFLENVLAPLNLLNFHWVPKAVAILVYW